MTARRAVAALAVSAVLVLAVGCSGSSDPDPGAPGARTELDGGVSNPSSSSTTGSTIGGGGGSRGATSGNQILPGETTVETAQTNG